MKLCYNVKTSVFCDEDENEEKILDAVLRLFPFSLEKEKIELKKTRAKGFNEKEIVIFEVNIKKERHINAFLDFLNEKLNDEQKELIIRQLNSRIDNDLNLFLRFDKDKLINENKLWLIDKGNCFHIRISIAAFPKKKERAEEVVRKIFKVGS